MTIGAQGRRLTISTAPIPHRLRELALNYRWRTGNLAPPPEGQRAAPGDRGLPLLGHGLEWLRYGPKFERARFEQYGPVSWMRAFGVPMAMIGGADATQAVLTNPEKAFSQRGWDLFFDPFFRRGLLLLDFDEHRLHRRIMHEAFTRPRLAGYAEVTGEVTRKGLTNLPKNFLLYPMIKRLTLDIASQVFMATELGANERVIKAFVDSLQAATALIRFPVPGGKWRKGIKARQTLENYFLTALPGKRTHPSSDLFSVLATIEDEDGRTYSDEDVVNHMIFLMLAAHDTTASTITAATYFLATHPEWQDRAREESRTLGENPDINGLERLTTLELVIKETLRLVAPLPSYVRKTVRDTTINGVHLPKGTTTVVMPAANHYDPTYWRDPEVFDPTRFAEPRREDRAHRYAWLPFGGGVHKCIGMHLGMLEVKTVLHELLLRHQWRVPAGYEITWDWANAPRPVDGLPIILQ